MAELYTQEEIDALEMHIDTYFGSYDRVFHELVSPDIHVDICIIPPSEERPYYTLVTQGMGAHCMNVPQELADYKLERAELMIALPPDWLVGNEEEKWYWPIRSLKAAARMVIEQNTWLGWGHSVSLPDSEEDRGMAFSGLLVLSPVAAEEGSGVCALPDGGEVNFYSVLPLYAEELACKCRHDAETLLNRFEQDPDEIQLWPVDVHRKNVCAHFLMGGDGQEGENVPILSEMDVEQMERFEESNGCYFGKMLEYLLDRLHDGVENWRFTEAQARADREVALWYAYACNNLDEYEYYYRVTQWMPDSEQNAGGCGAWYYRYACALVYCGQLEKALHYAEKGVRQEPAYPWGWLQLGKLRAHFGDKTGALECVARGLALEPGDYEFTTLQREIKEGCSIEEMEYHYISPEADRELQLGELVEEGDAKAAAIAGIVCDRKALEEIKALFQAEDWQADCPYCSFHFTVAGTTLEAMFRMNEAALSKLPAALLQTLLKALEDREYHVRTVETGVYRLRAVIFERDHSARLYYEHEETENILAVRILRDDQCLNLPSLSLLDMALMDETQNDEGEKPVLKLYRKNEESFCYAECRVEEDQLVIHTGIVGEAGKETAYPCGDADVCIAMIEEFRGYYAAEGYEEWPEEESYELAVQLPLRRAEEAPFVPEKAELALRDRVRRTLTRTMNALGLGYVDGWDMGRRKDTEFLLILYCTVVDPNLAADALRAALEETEDCSHLQLGVRTPGEERYALLYSADGKETFDL